MNNSRFEWKVGLFVFIGMVLIALLMLNFSKGITLFQQTYELHVVMPTVAGLKPNAGVMMAGVPVGTVVATTLSPEGRSVDIAVRILSKYKIYPDSKFYIDSLGFLGDQYIAVTPPTKIENQEPLKNGAIVYGEPPFNLQEAVRSTSDLLEQARATMKNLDQAITNVNRTVLNEKTLADFGVALSNLQTFTGDAVVMAKEARAILQTNAPAVNSITTNLNAFSHKLNVVAEELNQTLATNRAGINESVQNFRESTAALKRVSGDLEQGKGLAGSLLKDEQLKAETAALISNANAMAYNLSIFSSNLNQNGLWAMLKRPKHPPATTPQPSNSRVRSGKHD